MQACARYWLAYENLTRFERVTYGNLVAVRIGTSPSTATAYYPFLDNVGSVRNLVNVHGTLANSYTYSAYGTTLTSTEASGASQPYRYGGGYTDTITGLIKLGIRY